MNDREKVTSGSRKTGMAAFSKLYLIAYNGVQTVGWSYILFKALKFLAIKQSGAGLWTECCTSVTIFQSLAILEVLNCILGLVPSSAFITFFQVASRVFMVWAIVNPVERTQNSFYLPLMLTAWGVTEVVRYSYYFTNLVGRPPKFLTWCRYSLFLGLYPLGVTGEMGTICMALDTIKKKQLFSISLPNQANISFNFYYFCLLVLLSYGPLFPQLFGHMLRQRRKVLGQSTTRGVAKTKLK